MPLIQSSDNQRSCQTGRLRIMSLMASIVWLIGLLRAKAWSHDGMVEIGTKAELANTSGKIQMKPAAWAASGSRTLMPIRAEIHEKARPKNTARAKATIDST